MTGDPHLRLVITNSGEQYIFGCIYCSPNSSKESNEKLGQLLKEVQCSQIMIMGNFNFPNMNQETISIDESNNSDTY